MKTETSILSATIIIVIVISFYIRKPDFGSLVQILFLETSNRNIVDFTKSNVDFLRLLLSVATFMIICLQYRQIVLNTGKLLRVGQKNDNPNFSRSLR